jgi:hypothetical protein
LERGIEIIKQGACGVLHGYHQQTERYVRVLILGVIRETHRRSIRHFQKPRSCANSLKSATNSTKSVMERMLAKENLFVNGFMSYTRRMRSGAGNLLLFLRFLA